MITAICLVERVYLKMIPSLPKLLALAAVIWAVWIGFRLLERLGGPGSKSEKPSEKDKKHNPNSALDLVECKSCRAWVVVSEINKDLCEKCQSE